MAALPTGTVTFLFTDIEGSTHRWEEYGEAMQAAVARHDELLRSVVGANGGVVFKTGGDAIYAVFPAAPQALAAALEAQRRLAAEDWSQVGALRVRMAVHTGTAETRDDDYFGPTLNRLARILASAAGGQVLVSGTSAGLVQRQLPHGAELKDLGRHRFRDLSSPEEIFQLSHADLPSDFPPLKSLDARPDNLPIQVTSFVGREKELARIKELLATSRLLTLTGAGGTGKTRLAIEAAADLLDLYPDGVWFVDLAPLGHPELVPQTAANSMGVREHPGQPILNTILNAVGSKHVLVVLDNCEHLVEACARLADALIRSCPNLRVLATSREALTIVGETTWRVPPLGVADPAHLPPVQHLTQCEAVRLFIDRARAAKPDFILMDENARAVAQICRRLDGIPLALELAAARVKVLSPDQIAERLDDRFRLLTGGGRTVLPRQRSLRALVDWSFELLDEQESAALRRLSVFAGSWTLEAAEAVCPGDDLVALDVLDLISALVDKSLVYTEQGESQRLRYRVLETVRQYGYEKLREAGEVAATEEAHIRYFLALAEDPRSKSGRQQGQWMDDVQQNLDNFRVALGRILERAAMEERPWTDIAYRFVRQLGRYWYRNEYAEGRQWIAAVAALPGAGSDLKLHAHMLFEAGRLAGAQNDFITSEKLLCDAMAISQELDHAELTGAILCSQAYNAVHSGDLEGAVSKSLEAHGIAELCRHQGISIECWQPAMARTIAGIAHVYLGHPEVARSLLEQALEAARDNGQSRVSAMAQTFLAHLSLQTGDLETALAGFEEAAASYAEIAEPTLCARAISSAGLVLLELGRIPAARDRIYQAIEMCGAATEIQTFAAAIGVLGALELAHKQPFRAVVLLTSAMTLHPAAFRTNLARLLPRLSAAKALLTATEFEQAELAGRAMTLGQALVYARQAEPSQSVTHPVASGPHQ